MLILHLHRPWFDAIAQGYKRFEYRKVTPYWTKRIEGRKYDQVLLHNGYRPTDPQLVMAYKGYERIEGESPHYKLLLGDIQEVRNYEIQPAADLPPAAECVDMDQCFSPLGHRDCMYRCTEKQRWLPKALPTPVVSVSVTAVPPPPVGREIGRISLAPPAM
jgi:hypothetical protein